MRSAVQRLKRAQRRQVREAVGAMTSRQRQAAEEAIGRHLLAWPVFRDARTVLLYASAFPEEIATWPLLEAVLAAGKRLLLPRIGPTPGQLTLCRISDLTADLVPGRLGIPEPRSGCATESPEAIDLAVVPGLAFDPAGYRVGRGGGYYDRLLAHFRQGGSGATTCALAYEVQVIPAVAREAHDQPVQFLITEHGIRKTRPGDERLGNRARAITEHGIRKTRPGG